MSHSITEYSAKPLAGPSGIAGFGDCRYTRSRRAPDTRPPLRKQGSIMRYHWTPGFLLPQEWRGAPASVDNCQHMLRIWAVRDCGLWRLPLHSVAPGASEAGLAKATAMLRDPPPGSGINAARGQLHEDDYRAKPVPAPADGVAACNEGEPTPRRPLTPTPTQSPPPPRRPPTRRRRRWLPRRQSPLPKPRRLTPWPALRRPIPSRASATSVRPS